MQHCASDSEQGAFEQRVGQVRRHKEKGHYPDHETRGVLQNGRPVFLQRDFDALRPRVLGGQHERVEMGGTVIHGKVESINKAQDRDAVHVYIPERHETQDAQLHRGDGQDQPEVPQRVDDQEEGEDEDGQHAET